MSAMRDAGEDAGRRAAYLSSLPVLLDRIAHVCEAFGSEPDYAVGFIAGVASVFDATTDLDVATDERPPSDGAFTSVEGVGL